MVIEGKFNRANVYASNIDENAIRTIQNLLNLESLKDAEISIMPDVHKCSEYSVVGYVQKGGKILPSMVSADICCSILVMKLGKVELDLEKFDEAVKEVNYGSREDAEFDFSELRYLQGYSNRSEMERRALQSLSISLGNHFLEVNRDEEGNLYLTLHSGSRNLGGQIYKHYQEIAEKNCNSTREEVKKIVDQLKSEGRFSEIQDAIKAYKDSVTAIPKELCWLEGQDLEDYIWDCQIAREFADYNKKYLISKIFKKLGIEIEFDSRKMFTTYHNYIGEDRILRKGAIAAYRGELVYIPISMKEGGIIVELERDSDMLKSFPHGAGRTMSRAEASKKLNVEDFEKEMEGIYSSCVNKDTLDEAPSAYKEINSILPFIEPYAKRIIRLKPIYNFKEASKRY